jgi:hypothetical protein
MEIKILGYNVIVEKEVGNWQSKVIRLAKKAGKIAGYEDMEKIENNNNGFSWKINRIKAIRLLDKPYPEITNDFYYSDYDSKKSSLSSAKLFVERYWNK